MVRCAISFLNKYGGIKDCISIETIWFHLYVETKKKKQNKKEKDSDIKNKMMVSRRKDKEGRKCKGE